MILVIGGMGFIGLNTTLRFLEVGQRVVISQHSARRVPDELKGEIGTRVLVAQMDVTNPYEVFDVVRRHQVESIVNLMAPPARSLSTQADYHPTRPGCRTCSRPDARSDCAVSRSAARSASTAAFPSAPIARTLHCR